MLETCVKDNNYAFTRCNKSQRFELHSLEYECNVFKRLNVIYWSINAICLRYFNALPMENLMLGLNVIYWSMNAIIITMSQRLNIIH